MKCENCGGINHKENEVCEYCGLDLISVQPLTAPPSEQQLQQSSTTPIIQEQEREKQKPSTGLAIMIALVIIAFLIGLIQIIAS